MPTWAKTPGMLSVPSQPSREATWPTAALGRPLFGARVAAPSAEETGPGQLLDPDGQAVVALAGFDRHDRSPEGGRPGGAGVGHVVDGNARLADLLLQVLADLAAHEVAKPQDSHVFHR